MTHNPYGFKAAENIPEATLRFLKAYRVPLSVVMDAQGMSPSTYHPYMKTLGFDLAVNTWRTCKEGHNLKDRHYHCVMCRTASLEYLRRHYRKAYIYVAYSHHEKLPLTKIGTSEYESLRQDSLNCGSGYAGRWNWQIIYSKEIENAGKVENAIQTAMADYAVKGKSYRNGNVAREVFDMEYEKVVKIVKEVIGDK